MALKIDDERYILAPYVLWLVNYDHSTGLVLSMSDNEADAITFPTEDKRSAVLYLINNNDNNSFIGQVPHPH